MPAKRTQHFSSTPRADVPNGRNGKHKSIVSAILADLGGLKDGAALKIPFRELGDSKENVRSALSRESRKQGRPLGTAADAAHLYVWNKTQ